MFTNTGQLIAEIERLKGELTYRAAEKERTKSENAALRDQLAAVQSKLNAEYTRGRNDGWQAAMLKVAEQVPAEPLAYLIEDSNGDGKAIRAKDIDKASLNRLIAVTVTPLYLHPAPAPEGMVADSCDCVNAAMECSERPNCRVSARLDAAITKETEQ